MDFFERQHRARRRTRWLVVWFALAVVAIVLAVYGAVQLIFVSTQMGQASRALEAVPASPYDPKLFAIVAAAVVSMVAIGSLYKIQSLSDGGDVVATMLGGRPIDPNTNSPSERRLLNVVEEMAIASGTPVPTVFLLAREPGINAFAAGFTSSDAVIGVTQGTIDHLTRDELQGVIAHELSHVLNGDMRLNLRLMGVLNGILVLALAGYWMLRTMRFADRRSAGVVAAFAMMGVALLAIGWIGVFFGRLIKSGVSRQRELLADSSAVQFTRNPQGLAGALRKIGGLSAGSRIRSPRAEEASHLFFGNGMKSSFFGWFSTHPPLEERIRLLDPGWDGVFPEIEPKSQDGGGAAALGPGGTFRRVATPPLPGVHADLAGGAGSGLALAGAAAAAAAAGAAAGRKGAALDAERAAARVGTLEQEMLQHAQAVVASLPEELSRAVHEPAEAEAVIYALLLVSDPEQRQGQLDRLKPHADATVDALLSEMGRALRMLRETGEEHRLPIVDLALPALRRMSDRQYRVFLDNVQQLASGHGELRLFEFTLRRILARHLAPHFDGPEPSRVVYYSLKGLLVESSTLLSALAWMGGDERAADAFAAGKARLDPRLAIEFLPVDRCRLVDVDSALRRLAQVAHRHKRQLIEAIVLCIAHDRKVTIEEAELLRAICDALDSPMPPFLPGSLAA